MRGAHIWWHVKASLDSFAKDQKYGIDDYLGDQIYLDTVGVNVSRRY